MDMKDIIINSLRYTTSNWIKVLLLGLVIFMADISNELTVHGYTCDILRYVTILAGIILGIYQFGFIFRIIKETTLGNDKMPKFDRYVSTFIHGLKEVLVTVIYFIIPFILIIVSVMYVDDMTGPKTMEIEFIFIFSGLFLASLTYIIYQSAVLNMANNHGTVKSAFDFKSIFKKVRVIGIKRLGFIYLLTVVFVFIVEITLADAMTFLPYDLGDLISSFLIAPFLLIFIARTLGLINKTLET